MVFEVKGKVGVECFQKSVKKICVKRRETERRRRSTKEVKGNPPDCTQKAGIGIMAVFHLDNSDSQSDPIPDIAHSLAGYLNSIG